MARNVESKRALEHSGAIQRALLTRLRQLFEGLVGTINIRFVMLAVMQLHDAGRYMRLQSAVVVGEIGQCVAGHVRVSLGSGDDDTTLRATRSRVNLLQILARPPARCSARLCRALHAPFARALDHILPLRGTGAAPEFVGDS